MRGATGVTLQPRQNSAPATQNDLHAWSSPHMKRHLQCAEQQVSPSNLTKIVRLPRKMTCMLDPLHIWNAIYNARSNKCHTPTSPNIAPVTQNDLHAWSSPHMERHLQCAEQQVSPSNLTKYCACHAKWSPKIWQKFVENRWNVIWTADPSMIQAWSEHEPVGPQPAAQPRLLFALATSILYWNMQHFALRLAFQISPGAAPATKSDTWTSPSTVPATKSDSWASPSTAPVTKSHAWTWPSTAPATKNSFYFASTITWRFRFLLLDSTIPCRFLLLGPYSYLTIPITWRYYYVTIPMTWHYYFTILIPTTWLYYYLQIPITWLY